jgi:hypothetical protein
VGSMQKIDTQIVQEKGLSDVLVGVHDPVLASRVST